MAGEPADTTSGTPDIGEDSETSQDGKQEGKTYVYDEIKYFNPISSAVPGVGLANYKYVQDTGFTVRSCGRLRLSTGIAGSTLRI